MRFVQTSLFVSSASENNTVDAAGPSAPQGAPGEVGRKWGVTASVGRRQSHTANGTNRTDNLHPRPL